MSENNKLRALGNAIKRAREQHGLSSGQLALMVDTTVKKIEQIECGKVEANLVELAKIAKALGRTATQLCEEAGL